MKERSKRDRRARKRNECGGQQKQVLKQACCVPVVYCDEYGCSDYLYCC
ncbi:hypothetical protein JXD38_03535 [candidate division WOR-3 bacterium]|nr:hypothetical protein [candidate division WOR-3 bacterium]